MVSVNVCLAVLTVISLSLISTVQAGYKRCGIWDCYGTGVYCCNDPFQQLQCCFYVYTHWWFWCIWVVGIVFIIAITAGCCRARRRRINSGIVVHQVQPVYGTTSTYGYSTPAPGYNQQYATPQLAAPPRVPTNQEKPPAYLP